MLYTNAESALSYGPLTFSPSIKIASPFLKVDAVLQLDMIINSSLVSVFKALNSLTIHCSHLLILHALVTHKITINMTNIIYLLDKLLEICKR